MLKKLALLIVALLIAVGMLPTRAIAHPLDEFYQATYLDLAPNRVTLQLEQYMGVLLAPTILASLDPNGDDIISDAEAAAFVEMVRQNIVLEINGEPQTLTATNIQISSPLDLRAGIGVIQFDLYTDTDQRGPQRLRYENNFLPDVSTYQVNAIGDAARLVEISMQERDRFQKQLIVEYTIDEAAPIDYGVEASIAASDIDLPGDGGVTESQQTLAGYLYSEEFSLSFLLLALGVSMFLGAVHALTPGHGKTLVAAYLIGHRGTIKHAMALGGIVTFTHTASVIAIGLLALLASQYIVPEVLTRWLEIASGLLVIYVGLMLLWNRWRDHQREGAAHAPEHHHHHHEHDHDHAHEQDQPHPHDPLMHHHGDGNYHSHAIPDKITARDLVSLGVSGGLVPCPEALVVMLLAIGLNRILLGLGMIVAFSFGLAAVLIIIGIMLVRSKGLLDRLSGAGGRWQTVLPVLSAIVVTLLGVGIIIKGVWL